MIDQSRPSERKTEEYPCTGQDPVHSNSYHLPQATITEMLDRDYFNFNKTNFNKILPCFISFLIVSLDKYNSRIFLYFSNDGLKVFSNRK